MKEDAQKQAHDLVEKLKLKELMAQLRHDAPAIERLGIPSYNWWNEGLHGAARSGTATVFPQAIGLASLFDPEFLFTIAETISIEQRAKYNLYSKEGDRDIYKGLTVWSPNVNIFRDPRWGRGQETFGEDPLLTSVLAVAFIKGLQGEGKVLRTASCVKHLAAHSGPEPIRHSFNAQVGAKDLEETYLPAFKAAVTEADVDAVMGAYSALNGEPCCGSFTLIEKVLRQRWGFTGMYISDCWAIRDFHLNHKVTRTEEESAALALKAGCDLNCGCEYQALEKAYQKKLITREDLKRAARRVFATRFRLGLLDKQTEYDTLGLESLDSEQHADYAYEAARRSLVLLKNDHLLPLDSRKLSKIAIIGPNADSTRALWGNYHGTSSRYTTILKGLRDHLQDNVQVLYGEGSSLTKERVERLAKEDDRLAEAVFLAKASDVVLLCLGLDESVEGEMHDDGNGGWAGDKKDLRLPLCQQKLLKAVASTGKPVIVLLLSGGALDPQIEAYPNVKALIQGWYPGQAGGRAVADLLFGRYSPSAVLPITFYKASADLPPFTDYSMKGRTYRYVQQDQVLFPFGFGLSYASFSFALEEAKMQEDGSVLVQGRVRNTSSVDSRHVVQLYLAGECPDLPAHPVLAGFASLFVPAGQELTHTFLLKEAQFTAVNQEGQRYAVKGRFHLSFGGSQGDELSQRLGAAPVSHTTFIR